MSEQAEAIATELESLPTGETPEAITIEAPEGVAPETKGEPEKPKKTRPPANVFISQLRNEKEQLLTANERLLQELELERQKNRQGAEQLSAATAQSMVLHEGKLRAEADGARRAYEEAFVSQDAKKQADATASLARAESGLADIEAWKARQPAAKPEAKPEQREERQPPPPQLDATTQGWMDENTWFSPVVHGQRNPDFNKTMHLTAVAYASRLEDRYRAEGRVKDIAGQEYWDEINNHMAGQFPDELGIEQEAEVVEAPRPRPTVAPAVRGAAPGAQRPANKQTITLSGDERQFVDQMRNSGAMIYPADYKDPKVRGQRMSPNDSYIAYWKQKQAEQNSQGR